MIRRSILWTVLSTHRPLCLQCAGWLHGRPRVRVPPRAPPRAERGMAGAAATAVAPNETATGSGTSTAAEGTDAGVGGVCFPGVGSYPSIGEGLTGQDPAIGPLVQYDSWVREGKLRDDAFQRGLCAPPPPPRPTPLSATRSSGSAHAPPAGQASSAVCRLSTTSWLTTARPPSCTPPSNRSPRGPSCAAAPRCSTPCSAAHSCRRRPRRPRRSPLTPAPPRACTCTATWARARDRKSVV